MQENQSKTNGGAVGLPEGGLSKSMRGTRVLVVGHDGQVDRVQSMLGQDPEDKIVHGVGGYLMALGQVVEDQPEVLVGHLEGLDEPLEATVQALKRLSPQTRLVLLIDSDRESEAKRAQAAGFDACVVEPTEPSVFGRVVWGKEKGIVRGSAKPGKVVVNELGLEVAKQVMGEAKSKAKSKQAGHDEPGCDNRVGKDLGDIDLVASVLANGRGVRDLGLEMIAKQGGIMDAGMVGRGEAVPQGHASCALEQGGKVHSVLHAPGQVSEAELKPWADWLGQWLALEDRVQLLWDLAMHDELTGVWNRRYFNYFLRAVLRRATHQRFQVTLLVFDIDDFKQYNDQFGHLAGDEILQEVSRLMRSVVREHDVVSRIGGDEFAVIFWDKAGPREPDSEHPQDVRKAAQRFQQAICNHRFPKLGAEAPGELTVSGGLASFPWDGRTPEELLNQADKMAMRAKGQGKNAITIGPGITDVCKNLVL